ncbi:MAG TPA: hypothetical protein VM282_05310 [Acidimicrobiales bacterium]|nr:hypothetical protein [Acidimicrobiales bacterium]
MAESPNFESLTPFFPMWNEEQVIHQTIAAAREAAEHLLARARSAPSRSSSSMMRRSTRPATRGVRVTQALSLARTRIIFAHRVRALQSVGHRTPRERTLVLEPHRVTRVEVDASAQEVQVVLDTGSCLMGSILSVEVQDAAE